MSRMLKALQQIKARSPQADQDAQPATPAGAETETEVLPLQAAAGREPGTPWPTPTDREHLQAYADLAGTIVSQLASHCSTVLLFTSPCDGDAEAGMLAWLAAAVAGQISGEVLVVDANLPAPALTEYLGVEAAVGLSDVLRGDAAWKEVVCRSTVARLSLLPGPTPRGADGRHAESEYEPSSAAPLIRELREVYDVVLIDAPSLAHEEAAQLAHHCDGVYLAVRLGHTPGRAVDEAVRVVGDCGGQVLGSILIGP